MVDQFAARVMKARGLGEASDSALPVTLCIPAKVGVWSVEVCFRWPLQWADRIRERPRGAMDFRQTACNWRKSILEKAFAITKTYVPHDARSGSQYYLQTRSVACCM
jgi:hypothetical protein